MIKFTLRLDENLAKKLKSASQVANLSENQFIGKLIKEKVEKKSLEGIINKYNLKISKVKKFSSRIENEVETTEKISLASAEICDLPECIHCEVIQGKYIYCSVSLTEWMTLEEK